MKRILFVSHCILNKASKVKMDEAGLKDEYAVRDKFLRTCLDMDVQLVQFPCPEFMMLGSQRWGHVRDQFDNQMFRDGSRKLIEPFIRQMKEYEQHPDEFEIEGIVSVEGSPSCGYNLTCTGNYGGELENDPSFLSSVVGSVKAVAGKGVFMEELSAALDDAGLNIKIRSMDDTLKYLESINK